MLNVTLGQEQQQLLTALVEAERNPNARRQKFRVYHTEGTTKEYTSIEHPGLQNGKRDVFMGDIEELHKARLIAHHIFSDSVSDIFVTIEGFAYYDHLQRVCVTSTSILPSNKSKSPSSLGVFLCHSSNDKAVVRDLYNRLGREGFAPWLDEEDILPGQDWDQEIHKAVRVSDVVLVCLSQGAITKKGYLQKEISHVLDVAVEQPEGAIFVIPVKLDECDIPERLRRWQWVDLFDERGFERLMRALQAVAQRKTA